MVLRESWALVCGWPFGGRENDRGFLVVSPGRFFHRLQHINPLGVAILSTQTNGDPRSAHRRARSRCAHLRRCCHPSTGRRCNHKRLGCTAIRKPSRLSRDRGASAACKRATYIVSSKQRADGADSGLCRRRWGEIPAQSRTVRAGKGARIGACTTSAIAIIIAGYTVSVGRCAATSIAG